MIADGVLLRKVQEDEQKNYQYFLDGLVLPNISQMNELKDMMVEIGFKNVKVWDKTEDVKKSSKIMYKRVRNYYPLAKLLYKLGLVSPVLFRNSQAGLAQYKLVKSGAAGYAVFYGEK